MAQVARNSTPTTTAREPIKVMADIIQNQLGLAAGQVMLDYEKYQIPPEGLFIVLGYLGPAQALAANSTFDFTGGVDSDIQEAAYLHHVQIDIMSMMPDDSARLRCIEVPMALRSQYSLQQQELYAMGIPWLQSDITDTSTLEGASMLNRFTLTSIIQAVHSKVMPSAGYLESFSDEMQTEEMATPLTIDPTINPVPQGGA